MENQVSRFSDNNLHIFFDLEGVLIESVFQWVFNKSEKLLGCIQDTHNLPDIAKIHLFSFAIWDESDLKLYSEQLEQTFNHFKLTIDSIIFKNDVLDSIKKIKNIQELDHYDVSTLLGKEEAFKCFCIHNNIHSSILLDDTVNDMEIKIKPNIKLLDPAINRSKLDISIQYINIQFE